VRGKLKRKVAVFFLLFLTVFHAAAPELAAAEGGEDLVVKIAVFGPGDELYFWWGHLALIIENIRTGQSRSYDFGLFSFENDHFFANFAFGRLIYSSGSFPAAGNIAGYVITNRDVTLYTLDLPPEEREEIYALAENSILPGNRDYLYHHFKDNCVTRILSILDTVTYGQFKERYGNTPGRFTLRGHIRRHTWYSPFVDWILNFWMGRDIDIPVTVWEEMFLPSEAGNRINEFTYTDSSGNTRRLVSDVEYFYKAQGRRPVLDVPRARWPRELVFGLALSLFLGLLFFTQTRSPPVGQVALGICHTLLGLSFGVAGLLLFFMSAFTAHDYTYHNINLLFCNPLLLVAVPLGIRYASADNYNKRLFAETSLRLLWLLSALGVFFSMLVELNPRSWQDNLADQLLMLPVALTLSLEPAGLRRLVKRIFWRRWLKDAV